LLRHATKHNQVGAHDIFGSPKQICRMALGASAAAQTWDVKIFPDGCSPSCYPPPLASPYPLSDAQAVMDSAAGAMWLFRSDSNSDGDVWRLDLTPGSEAWVQVDQHNYLNGQQ